MTLFFIVNLSDFNRNLIIFIPLLFYGLIISFIDNKTFLILDFWIFIGFAALALLALLGLLSGRSVALGIILGGGQLTLARFISRGGVGWGDVKYASVLAGWIGVEAWLSATIVAGLIAIICFIPDLIRNKQQHEKSGNIPQAIPFAPFLTTGALMGAIITPFIKGIFL